MNWFSVLCALLVSLWIGYKTNHKALSNLISRAVFIVTLGTGTTFCVLMMDTILKPKSANINPFMWRLLTAILLPLLVVVLPAVHVCRIVARFRSGRVPAGLVMYTCYLASFLFISARLPINRTQYASGSTWYALRQDMLATISCIGIILMAMIGGISSVSAPYIAFFQKEPVVTESTIQRLQLSINNTNEMIQQQEMQLNRLRLDLKNRSRKSSTNLVGKFVSALRGDDLSSEIGNMTIELSALQRLKGELVFEKATAEEKMKAQQRSGTAFGRFSAVVFSVFSVYCTYRVVTGFVRMGWWFMNVHHEAGSNPPRDALVTALASWAHTHRPEITEDGWARLVGLVISVTVLGGSLNGVRGFSQKVLRRFSKTATVAETDPLFAVHVGGIYLIAVATVLQLNIPKSMSGNINAALESPLNVNAIQLLNDVVLCSFSAITLGVLAIASHLTDKSSPDEEAFEKYL